MGEPAEKGWEFASLADTPEAAGAEIWNFGPSSPEGMLSDMFVQNVLTVDNFDEMLADFQVTVLPHLPAHLRAKFPRILRAMELRPDILFKDSERIQERFLKLRTLYP